MHKVEYVFVASFSLNFLSRAEAAKNAKSPVPMVGVRQRLIYCFAQMSR